MRQVLDTAATGPALQAVGLDIAGPWDRAAAARFGFGPREAGPDGTLRLAFLRDDLEGHAGVVVRPGASASAEAPAGQVVLEVHGDVPAPGRVAAQAARVLSLDRDARPWAALAAADPVLAPAHVRHPGLRPVLFGSPWEAATWAVLSQRRRQDQARALHRRLAAELGAVPVLAGVPVPVLPTPRAVLDARELPVPATPAGRLRALAAAALDGALDAERLRESPAEAALAALGALPGIGPFSAGLILVRATGAVDVLPPVEPRVRAAAARAAGDPALAGDEDAFRTAAEAWRPWRTWACVLLRVDAEGSGRG